MDGVLSGVKLLPNVPTGTVGTIEWHSVERTPLPKPNSPCYLLLWRNVGWHSECCRVFSTTN